MIKINPKEYVGKKIGRLTGIEEVKTPNNRYTIMRWKCDCGKIVDIPLTRVKNGRSLSCGCLAKELASKRLKKSNKYDLSGEYGIGYLSSGYKFYFDLDDYEKINNFCWHKHKDGYLRTRVGVYSNGKNHYELMHRWILNLSDSKLEVDHINGNIFDNRKANLRIVSGFDNAKNMRLPRDNKSGHKGVCFSNRENKWKAYIQYNNKKIHLGTFSLYDDAVKVRELAEIKYFGEYNRVKENLMNGTGV